MLAREEKQHLRIKRFFGTKRVSSTKRGIAQRKFDSEKEAKAFPARGEIPRKQLTMLKKYLKSTT